MNDFLKLIYPNPANVISQSRFSRDGEIPQGCGVTYQEKETSPVVPPCEVTGLDATSFRSAAEKSPPGWIVLSCTNKETSAVVPCRLPAK